MLKESRLNRIIIGFVGLVASLVIVELGLRALSTTTPDGAVFLLRTPCLPLRSPISQIESALQRYESDPELVIQYDPMLGWAPRPSGVSADGMYRYDDDGARIGSNQSPARQDAHVVTLFGDSTMHGTGVKWEDSIGARLQASWGQNKLVKNFALGAYGMDQALLRWRNVHSSAKPNIVLFGFQAENIKRNGSIFRSFYTYETVDIPFSKPRFALQNGELVAVNLPTLPPSEIVPTLRDFNSSPLKSHEYFYKQELYKDSWRFRSRLISFAEAGVRINNVYAVTKQEQSAYSPNGELGTLALRILRAFRDEVEQTGARFVVVHLPRKVAVEAVLSEKPLVYEEILGTIQNEFDLIDPLPLMAKAATESSANSLYVDPWHYSGRGAEVVAQAVITALP